jgi:hypothetical protein
MSVPVSKSSGIVFAPQHLSARTDRWADEKQTGLCIQIKHARRADGRKKLGMAVQKGGERND